MRFALLMTLVAAVAAGAAVLGVLGACSESPNPTGVVNGTIDGVVVASAPTKGVRVSAYALDLESGELGDVVATSEPTDEAGAFHLDLGNYFGGLVLIAQGVGGSYVEPASGTPVSFDATTRLRAAYVHWTVGGALDFEFERKTHAEDVILSPVTELALTYAEARQREGFSATWKDALAEAYAILHAHLEIDYFAVVPATLTEEALAGGWNASIEYAVELAGFSRLARKMSEDAGGSPAGVTTLQLLAALRRDLDDEVAKLDGQSLAGPLVLGTCTTVCLLSGKTFRGDLAEAAASFLTSPENLSGIKVSDALPLLERMAARQSEIFPVGTTELDSVPPLVTVEGLADADILTGELEATLTAVDAIAMGTLTVTFLRGGSPVTGFYAETPTTFDPQRKALDVALRTTELTDGPLAMRIEAVDASGNAAVPIELSLFVDNSPLGTVSGTVTVGSRLAGARVTVYEYQGGILGRSLGTGATDEEGRYFVSEVQASTATSLLVVADNDPAAAAATYTEPSDGTVVALSAGDRIESVLTGWVDGQSRTDGNISPFTQFAVSFARGLAARGVAWDGPSGAVATAYAHIEAHVREGVNSIDLRAVQPVELTADGVTTLNAQARLGLLHAALSELAYQHAMASGTTTASANTLSLLKLLGEDLGGETSRAPLWDGQTAAGTLRHGRVDLTSYTTRVDLAIAAVKFLEENPRDRSPFTELDVAGFLDVISSDENPALYPTAYPPIPYDRIAPAPLTFAAPTPPDLQVLRGVVALRAQASDNRALETFEWAAPADVVSVLLDRTAGIAGPWILSGDLDTETLPEGNVVIIARATDEALQTATISRTFTIDRTPPTVTITQARSGGASGPILPENGWTGSATIVISGTITDAHLAVGGASPPTYRWNGSAPVPLTLAGSAFAVTVTAASGGNTLVVSASDEASNTASDSATYNRDTTPPTVAVITSQVVDENTLVASVTGGTSTEPWGQVSYSGPAGSTVPLSSTSTASFSKFGPRYTVAGPNLPEWHWNVADNYSSTSAVRLFGRLFRGTTLLTSTAFEVPPAIGGGYNRAQTLSSALHPDLGTLSGSYRLEYFAEDEFGNASSPVSVNWTQTVLAPPVRQRAAAQSCPLDANRCPTTYGLGSDTTSHVLNGGGGVPGNRFEIAAGEIDNPNPIPVRVRVLGNAPATYSRGMVWTHPQVSNPSTIVTSCDNGVSPQLPSGACYSPGSTIEDVINNVTTSNLVVAIDVQMGLTPPYTSLPPCAGCAENERILPPFSSIHVVLLANPMPFLFPTTTDDLSSVGSLSNVTGTIAEDWLACASVVGGGESCADQVLRRAVHHLTRIKLTIASSVTLNSRPDNTSAAWSTSSPGTNTTGYSYYNLVWNTAETGWPTF